MKQLKGRFQSNVSVEAIPFSLLETVFFDIETTGFAAKSSKLYLIGKIGRASCRERVCWLV